uniref:Uncharacterized protein n=1 Tax=Salvator merianae TaxID=96440 RepID=A0A8D0BD83_SALMN
MTTDVSRQVGVWRQTRVLLYKNCLVKWRHKGTSLTEALLPLFYLGLLVILSMVQPDKRHNAVSEFRLPSANLSSIPELIGYVQMTNVTRAIMHKMASEYCIEEMEEALHRGDGFVGLIFDDSTSYHLRFPPRMVPPSSALLDSSTTCPYISKTCDAEKYWREGFIALQICIDDAIIQVKSNISVLKELQSTAPIVMGKPASVKIDLIFQIFNLICLVIGFSVFGYYLTVHIMSEKENKLKEFLMIMGLHDTAFW